MEDGSGIAPVEIAADGLLLRSWEPGDAMALLRASADPLIARWQPKLRVPNLAAGRALAAELADWSAGSHASFAVTSTATARQGQVLGSVSVHHISWANGDAEVGYWTLPDARGQGVAVRAVAAATRWAFESLGLFRVELLHAVGNVESCRVAVKAGFALEGTLRLAYRYGDGERHDEHLHARLATDATDKHEHDAALSREYRGPDG